MNCDGSTGYADHDGDRFPACEDCNDADPEISPIRVDICGDGIDQNCDGIDATCSEGDDTDTAGSADSEPVVDSDSDTVDSDTPPTCDSDESVVAFAGGWSCNTSGNVTVSLMGLAGSLLLARRRKR